VTTPLFTGSGKNDCQTTGTFTGSSPVYYVITVDATAPDPDTFSWTHNGTAGGAGINMAFAATALNNGISVKWTNINGHTVDEYWSFWALPLYPRTIPVQYSYDVAPIKNNIVTPIRSGADLVIRRWADRGSRWRFGLSYRIGTGSSDTISQFYVDRDGEYERFDFADFEERTYTGVTLGTGDGSRKVFDIPGDGISAYTVYDDGVAMTEGATDDYTVGDGTGVNGCDQIIFNSAPTDAHELTIDFTGYRWHVARFDGEMKRSLRGYNKGDINLNIVGEIQYG